MTPTKSRPKRSFVVLSGRFTIEERINISESSTQKLINMNLFNIKKTFHNYLFLKTFGYYD